jgi:multiple antibiotic resistance protein
MHVRQALTLWLGTFSTLLAVINPLEALPVFLRLTEGQSQAVHRQVAWRSCLYATGLIVFFLFFGNLVLRGFSIPLSMVRIVGGIILLKIGFEMFAPAPSGGLLPPNGSGDGKPADVTFVPLAMPIMVGPGVIATVLGMASTVKESQVEILSVTAFLSAIVAAVLVTYLALANAEILLGRIGPKGVDAATRITGFFVACMGMGLVFHGGVDALRTYGIIHPG